MSRAKGVRRRAGVLALSTLMMMATVFPLASPPPVAAAGCTGNQIEIENCLPGNPASEWDVTGEGDTSIQGFATDISVDLGQTVDFKIDTPSTNYRIDIYRLGWYGGDGARKIDTIQPSATLPQTQPACLFDPTGDVNLTDCGDWSVSASWVVPSDAVSGIYIARPVREDVGGDLASHIAFIVRDDDGHSDLLVQTSDTTWQAYNQYGGYSLYGGPGANDGGHAHKVSYNRPFTTRGTPTEDWLFNAEYPMVRWLERNGYDVSYFTDLDGDRRGAEILEHKVFMSSGHDEYWSAGQRASVEAARDAGVNLAFFSGNEVYWKTRWEPSTADGVSTAYRTLVSYKEGDAQGSAEHFNCFGNFDCDPSSTVWTGLWRQNQTGHDGGRPENALSGQISWGDATTAIEVPASAAGLRFWRNTDISGATTLTANALGYEFDWEQPAYASSNPSGRITLSDTIAGGGKNHKMSLYRAPSGALVFGAGSVQWSWGLDGNHDRGGSTADLRMQQATVNVLSDMDAQPATLQGGLVAGGALDKTAPTAAITNPAGGGNVPGGNITVSGTAADVGGLVAAVEVSTDGGTTWGRATGTTNWTYNFSAANGSVTAQARAVDDAANIGTAASVTFTATAQTCPCSIFTPSTTGPQENDSNPTELGVKFRSDAAGYITGIRFYKTAGNTGAHTGSLWSTLGVNLGTVTFAGESGSGWQEASFDSPIAIDADTTYVASYHTATGFYATGTSFASAGVDNPPLHALQGGVDGPNGVYRYGSGGIYPADTFGSSNYLVDAVYVTTVGPDTTPPSIIARSPAPSASGIAVGTNVTATFSEPVAAGSITATNVELRDPADAVVAATVAYNAGTRTATLDPTSALDHSTTYTATVKGGAGGVTDAADPANPLAADVIWTFTTAAPPPPPPDEGPGGPILVIGKAADPFSRFYAEILRNEGLNDFTVSDISGMTAVTLADYDVVILGGMALTAAQETMLEDWVTNGGNLIAMRPDKDLAAFLGLTDAGTTLSNGYLLADTASGPGKGIVGQTIQFHGTADRYALNGATSVATLYSSATTATTSPAVTLRSVGSNGGQVAAFTYDLARSVVYTRQGNPEWAGDDRDASVTPAAIIRSDDMFYGAKPGDVQPDWVDLNKVAIPQADEQQRLLVNLIEQMNLDRMPLPKFWYFPRGEKAVVVMTGDDHANGGTSGQFDWDMGARPANCDVANWDCVRGTSYIYPGTPLSDASAAAYEAAGFEIALHVNTNCANWTPASLESFYSTQLAQLAADYPSLAASTTNRTHCITWSDWATQPKVELNHGIRLDTTYYYWPDAWIHDRPGYFTGSGMPMRFADLDGSLIDVYQATTQMTDESGITYSTHINTLLDNALGAPGYYGVVTANMHTDNPNHPGQQTIVNAAIARGVPVVSARQMLTWLDGRNGSSFADLAWSGNTLSFTIAAGSGSNGLEAMVPTTSAVGALTGITRGASPVTFTTQTIKGIEYAFFSAAAGSYDATYAIDATAPAITNVVAVPDTNGTATITWTTNEAATSRVDYGTSPSTLDLNVSDAGLVTSHSIHVTGLAANTSYSFRVTSVDAASNSATSPNPPAAPATFTTPSAALTDTSVADFGAGTTGSSTYVGDAAGGEVLLAPTVGTEFSGTNLPSGWSSTPWTGGTVAVSGGTATVDGTLLATTNSFSPGRSVEFVATFGAETFEHAGLGQALASESGESWAMFSTWTTTSGLYARTNNNGSVTNMLVPGSFVGSPHRYRIDWGASSVVFSIDGAVVSTQAVAIGASLRPIASDFTNGGANLSVDWLHLTPHTALGTFTSRVLDAGAPAAWGSLAYVAEAPGGSSLSLTVRRGNTSTPDGTWSGFAPVSNGGVIGGSSRYIQYQATLSTSDTTLTPTLHSVTIGYSPGAVDTDPPGITTRTPASGSTGVGGGTDVTVAFDEPMDAATITGSTFTLRANGAGSDMPAAVSFDAGTATATLDPSTTLPGSTTFTVTVQASVADLTGNQLGADDTWTFTTGTVSSSLIDTTEADFGAGTTGANTYVAVTADGEVTLSPAIGAEFSGTTLPSGWAANPWAGGGSVVVNAGLATVDEAAAWTTGLSAPGRTLEFVANFRAPNQHAGLANDFNTGQWAIFSTMGGDQLYARSLASSTINTPLGATYLNGFHRYRIDWTSTGATYFIDGAQVAAHAVTFADSLRPAASDSNGAGTLAVDWMRLSPYSSPGTFTSRVLDAGSTVTLGTLSSVSDTPAGTTISFRARHGNTPTPDGTWSAFAALPGSGAIGGSARYMQYEATLTSSSPDTSPALRSVAIGFTSAPDTTAPSIAVRAPSAGATNVAVGSNVTITFDEPMDPATITGSTIRIRAQGAGSDIAAAVTYDPATMTATLDPVADLANNTTYNVSVAATVADASSNQLGSAVTWGFTTAVALSGLTDTTVSDFSAGTPDASTYVSQTVDGEVILAPTVGSEFNGASLPAGWSSTTWGAGGTSVVASGRLTVDGARANPSAAPAYGPGRSIEFVATFGAAGFQTVGFADTLAATTEQWVQFGTANSSTTLFARTNTGSNPVDVSLGTAYIGSQHRYRIDWTSSQVVYSIDGAVVHTATATVAGPLRPVVSDFTVGGPTISVEWLRMTPYAGTSTFTSRVLDAHSPAAWAALSWTAATPAGTTLGLSYHTGNTLVPDVSWTSFTAVPASGGGLSGTSRYIQYQAALSSTDPSQTPTLSSVSVTYQAGASDTTAPSVTSRAPAAGATGVAVNANVTATFNEPIDPATLTTSSVRLRAQGAGTDVAAAVSYNAATGTMTLDPSADLTGNTLYTATLASSIADTSGNTLGSDSTWTFRTVALPASFTDTTTADFGAGSTGANTYVSETANGEVILYPTVGAEFSGTSLPAGWSSTLWPGTTPGGSTVSGGAVTVDGGRAGTTTATFGQGRSLEFVATFSGQAFQHVGYVSDFAFNSPWAIFSTASAGGALYARSSNAGDTLIPGSWLNAPHRYRIDWTSTDFVYFIDGNQVASRPFVTTTPMRPLISDNTAGGGVVAVDWLRLSPYPSAGTFNSRIFDAGAAADWSNLSWTASSPAGTSVALTYRRGNTPSPDGTWSSFQSVASSGDALSGTSRYIQYRASPSTTSTASTPSLNSVTIGYVLSSDTTAPTVSISSSVANPTNAATFDVAIAFSELVTGLTLAEIGVGNGSAVSLTGSGAAYTVTISPAAEGTTTVDIPAGVAQDGAGNGNTTAVQLSRVIDRTAPLVTINQASSQADPTGTSPVHLSVVFGEPVADFATGDVTLAGTAGATTAVVTGSGTTYDVAVSGMTANGSIVANIAVGVAHDAAGNSSTASTSTDNTIAYGTNQAPAFDQDLGNQTNAEGALISLDAGATDPDGDPLTYAASGLPAGLGIDTATGLITGTIGFNAAATSPHSVSITVSDNVAPDVTDTFSWTVSNTNRAPVAADQAVTTAEDTATPITLGASDADGDSLTYAVVGQPTHGVLSGTAPSLTYTPAANYHGADSFTFKANDGTVDSNTATVSITVTPVNDAPVCFDGARSTAEDTLLASAVICTDVDGGTPTVTLGDDVSHGTLVLDPSGSFSYTPAANYHGADSFTFKANDGTVDSNTATVSITVTPVNDAPVALGDAYSTGEDTALVVAAPGVLGNDDDVDGDSLSAVLDTDVSHGTLALAADGAFSYTPTADYAGSDSFTYHASDGSLDSSVVTVTLTIGGTNDAPVAADQAVTTAEDTATPITLGASDADGDSLTYAVVGQPTHGVLSGTAPSLTYTPAANYHGADSFTFKANDGTVDSNTATVSITVTPVNDAPALTNPGAQTSAEGSSPSLQIVASDVDGDSLTYAASGLPSGLSISPTSGLISGSLDFTSAGSYPVTVTVTDGHIASPLQAAFSWTVGGTNQAPIAVDDTATVAEDSSATAIDVLTNDSDPDLDGLTVTGVSDPAHGTATFTAGGVTYTPDANYHGADSFSYTISDNSLSDTGSVAITVTSTNDAPVAADQAVTTAEDTATPITLGASDADGDSLTYAVVGQPTHGVLLGTAPSLTYTPAANYHGADSFTFKANDGTVDSNTATVSITVTPVNDAPVCFDGARSTAEDTLLASAVICTDVDGGTPTVTLGDDVSHGTLVLDPSGSFSYTPAANYHGADSFTFKANDGTVDSNTATVSITVTPVNDAPALTNPGAQTSAEGSSPSLQIVASDVDGDSLTYAASGLPSGLSISPTSGLISGSLDFTSAGSYPVTVTVTDGHIASPLQAAFSWTVGGTNQAPAFDQDLGNQTNAEGALISLDAGATDPDGDPLTYAASGLPAGLGIDTATGLITGTIGFNAAATSPHSVSITVSDNVAPDVTDTFSWTVSNTNRAPVAADQAVTTAEDTATPITLGASDADGDSLTYAVVGQPTHGVLSGTAPSLTYTPAANYHGADSFTFKANDGTVDSNTATVSITVTPVNDAPALTNPGAQTSAEGSSPSLQIVASDVDGDSLTYAASGLPSGLSISPTSGLISGSLDFTSAGSYPVTVTVTDGHIASPLQAAFSWTVGGTNQAPAFDQDLGNQTNAEGALISLDAGATDPDGDPLTYAASGLPAGLGIDTATGLITGTIGFNAAATSPHSVSITVSDNVAPDVTDTFSWTVSNTNRAPVAADQAVTTAEDTATPITLGASDADGDSLTYAVVGQPTHGVLSGTAPSLTYTPAANYHGADSFTFKANDGTVDSNTATVSITVTPVNDAPALTNPGAQTSAEGSSPSLQIVASDVDGDSLTYAASGLPSGLSISPTSGLISGSLDFTSAGSYPVTVTVTDGHIASPLQAAFSWTVTNVPGPSVTLSTTATNPTNQATIPVTAVFGASVTGFTASDITVTNGSVSGFGGSGTTYTFSVTATADGAVTVNVAADAAVDGSGRGNTAATTLTRVVDRAAPTITLTTPANGTTIGDQTPTLGGVAGTAAGDSTAVTVRLYTGSSVGATPLQTLNATANGTTGAYAVDAATLALGTYTAVARQVDVAGNPGTSASTTFTITDLTPPATPASVAIIAQSNGLTVDWPNNTEPDLAGYNVYRSASASGTFTKLNATLLAPSAYQDGTAPTDATSYYRVEAVDSHANASEPATANAARPKIAFVSKSTAQNGSGTSLVISRPSGTAAGDVLIAALSLSGNPTISVPSGWTLVQSQVTGPYRQVAYVRVVVAGENPSYAWSFSASTAVAGGISAYRGVDPSQPIEVAAGRTNNSSATILAPTVTTTSPAALLVGVFGMATNPAITPPGGMIEQFEIATSGKTKVAIESADRFVIPAGATGSMSATTDKSEVSVGQSIALRPANAGPPPPPPGDIEAPTKPTNVVASPTSPTRVDLTWNASSDNVGIDHYNIYRNGDATRIGFSNSATFADTSASPNTTYTYTVKAVDAAGNASDPSAPSNSATTPQLPSPPPPQVTFRSASYAANKSVTTLKIARPSGTASGDLLLASIDVLGTPTITPPAGWTLLHSDVNGTTLTKATYWRSAGGGEPADYVWTFSAAVPASGGVHAYRNVDPTSPIVSADFSVNTSSSTTIATPSVTISQDHVMLVAFFGIASSASITPHSGMSERGEVIGVGAYKIASEGADEPHDSGPSHTHDATASKAGVSISHVIVLRPAP